MPPSVNAGRIIAGKPILCNCSRAILAPAFKSVFPVSSLGALTIVAFGFSRPIRSIASRKSLRSSAISIACLLAPIISTPNFSSTPISSRAREILSPVWPPIVGKSASGRSFSIIFSTMSGVIGSMYVACASSGSVIIVAGFELTKTTRYPSSRKALQACAPE